MKAPKRAEKIVKNLKPTTAVRARLNRRVFRDFADRLGFVYFGYVDQRDDEHRLIRGLTQSTTHHDDHYCIGSYHGYDVALCERTDMVTQHGGPSIERKWLIMTADLHRKSDVPHILIGSRLLNAGFYRQFLTKYPYMQLCNPGTILPYSQEFHANFALYAKPTHAVLAEQLFGGELNDMLAQHFREFSFEVSELTLYVYAENARPTNALLSRILQCTSWLASEIDKR